MSSPAPVQVLPRILEPLKLCAQGAEFSGCILPKSVERLLEAVQTMSEPLQVSLRFYRDESGYSRLSGQVEAAPMLQCQRCLGETQWPVRCALDFFVITDEARINQLPRGGEAWIVNRDGGDIYELIEDELLLSLPIVAYHPESLCTVNKGYSTGGEPAVERKPNPFQVLEKLKVKNN